VKPGGTSAGGFPCVAPSVFACALACDGVVSGDATAGVVEVALVSAGADIGGVDDAAALSVVDDVAAGAVTATVVDEVIKSPDVVATCARTGLTTRKPATIAEATRTLNPATVTMLFFILEFD